MKETIIKNNIHLPYSLHDMKINQMKCDKNNITFVFKEGYIENKEPYKQIPGSIIVKDVDYDFCTIHLLSQDGEYGNFQGRKLLLKDFIKEYRDYEFEVIDELYGFNQLQYSGFMSYNNQFIEYTIDLYFIGNLVYLTKE